MHSETNLIRSLGLEPGDRIVVPKSSWNIVKHHALYLGHDIEGYHYICENVINVGVKLTRVNIFFHGVAKVTRTEKFNGSPVERKKIVQKALLKLGKPYSLINYNCESFCNDVQHNVIKSGQVSVGLFVGFVGLMLAVLNSDYGKQNV
nr:lecithin retinol acyltransferase family protein [uncultured Flavobacterium sp.]